MNDINCLFKFQYRIDEIIKNKEVRRVLEAFKDYDIDILWKRTAKFFNIKEETFAQRLVVSDCYEDVIYIMRLYIELSPEMQLKRKLENKKIISKQEKVNKI